jgi:hypothetical protein
MFAATAGSAQAALYQPNGGAVPLYVQGGVGLHPGTNSVKVTLAGYGSRCTPVDSTNNLNTGWQVREGDSITVDSFTDRACQGALSGPGIGYGLRYDGPSPKNTFTYVLVRARSASFLVCSTSGWTDNLNSFCRSN